MSADVLRRAAASMREVADSNTCCGDTACDDNWYARFLTSVADWLDAIDFCECSECEHAAFIASTYLGSAS